MLGAILGDGGHRQKTENKKNDLEKIYISDDYWNIHWDNFIRWDNNNAYTFSCSCTDSLFSSSQLFETDRQRTDNYNKKQKIKIFVKRKKDYICGWI